MLTFLTSILTILMSGVVSAVVTYRLNLNREKAHLLRQKAEELYMSSDQYTRNLFSFFIYCYPVLKGEMSRSDLEKKMIDLGEDSDKKAHQKTMMLISIYFWDLMPLFDELDKSREASIAVFDQHERDTMQGVNDDPRKYLTQFTKEQRRFDDACKRLQEGIALRARKIEIEPIIPRDSWLYKTIMKVRA